VYYKGPPKSSNLPTVDPHREQQSKEFFQELDEELSADVEIWINGKTHPIFQNSSKNRKIEFLSNLRDFESMLFRWKNSPVFKAL
jgi:hypothetical protein